MMKWYRQLRLRHRALLLLVLYVLAYWAIRLYGMPGWVTSVLTGLFTGLLMLCVLNPLFFKDTHSPKE